mmetsp:Transcript_23150/g.45554  ORF Transcript_23150/g.45554 Transcript_23150/m.45554 type:complete len:403 (-) Transcript_23150:1243-2451(-)
MPKGCLHLQVLGVDHSAHVQEDPVVPEAVGRLGPPVEILAGRELVGSGVFESHAHSLLDFCPDESHTVLVHGVLESRHLPVGSVTVVSLHSQDRGEHVLGLLRRAEAEVVCHSGEGLGVSVRRSHAASHGHSEALEGTAVRVDDRHKPDAVGEDVNVVVGGDSHSDLEFSGQVRAAVDGLNSVGGSEGSGHKFLRVHRLRVALLEEDLVEGGRAGKAVVRKVLGNLLDVVVALRGAHSRNGSADHVSVHVTARGDGVHAGFVHLTDCRLEVLLQDAVELEGLTGRHLQMPYSVRVREGVHFQPLVGLADPPGKAHTGHERVGRLDAQLRTLRPVRPVVLLVDAVEFDDLGVLVGHLCCRPVVQCLLQSAPQVVRPDLDLLVRGVLAGVSGLFLCSTSLLNES